MQYKEDMNNINNTTRSDSHIRTFFELFALMSITGFTMNYIEDYLHIQSNYTIFGPIVYISLYILIVSLYSKYR